MGVGGGDNVFYTLVLVPGPIVGASIDIHLYTIKAFWGGGGLRSKILSNLL